MHYYTLEVLSLREKKKTLSCKFTEECKLMRNIFKQMERTILIKKRKESIFQVKHITVQRKIFDLVGSKLFLKQS